MGEPVEATITDDAVAVLLGFFVLGPKSKLSYGGDWAEMEPTPNMAAAIDELVRVNLLDRTTDERGRITLRGRDWNSEVVKARVGRPFAWMEERRGNDDLGFREKGCD